jgi:regulator of protease activity HflC (stomatin/prohibitin superfamily)
LGFGAIVLYNTLFIIQTQTAGIIERWGRLLRIAAPGLGFKIPIMDRLVDELMLCLLELKVQVSTKTEDNVFVDLHFTVQYRVEPDRVADAHYLLEDEEAQICSYVASAVRAKVPLLTLKTVYEQDDEFANSIRTQLEEVMKKYGYLIESVLLTHIAPDAKVVASLNEIQASTNLRQAALQKAEAARVTLVKQAEAEAEAKELSGKGIAAQRKRIIEGLEASVTSFADATKVNPEEVINLVMLTQYFDMLHALSSTGPSTILVPYSPGAMGDFKQQMTEALLAVRPKVE